jgi:hypothetical protein
MSLVIHSVLEGEFPRENVLLFGESDVQQRQVGREENTLFKVLRMRTRSLHFLLPPEAEQWVFHLGYLEVP